jgi:hypothetical protein
MLCASELDVNYANKTTPNGEITSMGIATKADFNTTNGLFTVDAKYNKDISKNTVTDYYLGALYDFNEENGWYSKVSTAKRETKGIDQENKLGVGYSIVDNSFRYRIGLQEVQRKYPVDENKNLYSKVSIEYVKHFKDYKFKVASDIDRALDGYNTIITVKGEANHKITETVSLGIIHEIEKETAPFGEVAKNNVVSRVLMKVKF